MTVRFGVHLPLADFGDQQPTAAALCAYASAARQLGYTTLAANDHLVWRRPWLDGPTALATVLSAAGDMTVATTISLPVVRHPVVLAKALSTLAVLARGPLIAGLGPGSGRADYAAVGCSFEERWARFDEALALVRALLRGEDARDGVFYPAAGLRLDPLARPAPQVWFGSWGSDRRLRAMAGAADGWLASGYNLTPTSTGRRAPGSTVISGRPVETRPDSRTRSRQCGSTSPTTRRRPHACSRTCWPPRSDATRTSWPASCPSASPSTARRCSAATPRPAPGRSICGRSGIRIGQLERCAAQVLPAVRGTTG